MNDRHRCPLCTETFPERTGLQVHLEVNHRKSEVVTLLVDLHEDTAERPIDSGPTVAEEERSAPSAD
ncbi:hypothetical protein RBH26_13675 [Natronolimnohabitans sp. A-GB9]|uniref:hypothetical protein n=1 Tax=Natronolimnohabitans sp. A-GB9 TaxID=3069757 RepID=UPI0027AFCDA0|nr:hypothetical protein [Natronolimnohabitans sp. A-GB9]MDQ2051527.1 hypothetical protein [Natronolimnohabitans sp. A-GB9]